MSFLPRLRSFVAAGAAVGVMFLLYDDEATEWIRTTKSISSPRNRTTKIAATSPLGSADDVLVAYDDDEPVLQKDGGGTGSEDDNLEFSEGFLPHPNVYSDTYLPRGQSLSDEIQQRLTARWGSWTFQDTRLVAGDYYASYPSRDVPRSRFPSGAWQTDPDYLSKFLPEARGLVRRAMEGILAEYGHGEQDESGKTFDERSDMFYFQAADAPMHVLSSKGGGSLNAGGYMNDKSFGGLVRRVLHAIVTEDTFRVVTGGHSATAGHGNHFQQSYTLQIQRVLEPIFARLGVTMTAHNIAVGGLGTISNAMGAAGIYSEDIDVLIYDSGMTEMEGSHHDMFVRQGILSKEKVPFIWISHDNGRLFKEGLFERLESEIGADIGVFGTGLRGIPKTTADLDMSDIAVAAQYVKCDNGMQDRCRELAYMSKCWIQRDDVSPPATQNPEPGGRAKWHPGNRAHQLQGRVITFIILRAVDEAIGRWLEAEGYALKDADWHVHEHHADIRSKLHGMNHTTHCHDQVTSFKFPRRACDVSMQGRTEFSPRVNAHATSIRSIVKGGNLTDEVKPNVYDPPDVYNPNLDIDEVHLMNIVENGIQFSTPLLGRKRRRQERQRHQLKQQGRSQSVSVNPVIKPGLGWHLDTLSSSDNCDGSYDSFCGRSATNYCLLYGHNDYRGGLLFDGLSGWLILELEQVEHGLITVKIEDWHWDKNPKTENWLCENNECPETKRRGLEALAAKSESVASYRRRRTKKEVPEYCSDFVFEFAIDGKITTWDLDQWKSREQKGARVAQFWTLLDDPEFTDRPRDVEVAIRIKGCQRIKTFKLTHIYWS